VKLGRQVRLLCPWARHLTGMPLPYGVKRICVRYFLEALGVVAWCEHGFEFEWVQIPFAAIVADMPRADKTL